MTPIKWLLLFLGGLGVVTASVWWYRTREEPVAGRTWAMFLRVAALLLILLLLLNPAWPRSWNGSSSDIAFLLDASLSMARSASTEGRTLWDAARDSAANASDVWLFGGEPLYVAGDSLPQLPLFNETLLAPTIRSAGLAGARRVRVITDGRIADANAALAEARRFGLAIDFVGLAADVSGAGIAGLEAPAWARSGDTTRVVVQLVASEVDADSLTVTAVDDGGVVVASAHVPAPAGGRFVTVELALPVRGSAGVRRYEVRLAGASDDGESRDNTRAFYVRVSEEGVGPILISLLPDWEASFLLSSLARVTDAPTSSYYLIAGELIDTDGYGRVPVATVRRRANAASLLVVHGYAADAPEWVGDLVSRARRLLVLPAGLEPFDLPTFDVRIHAPRSSEWYVSGEIPGSPLALELSGATSETLPPLVNVRTIDAQGVWHPLGLRRLRRGEAAPALVAGARGSRRFAVATAEGYWRWAFRPGPGRHLYRSLWTGVAGWLTEIRSIGIGLDPRDRVVARGQPLNWLAPEGADSVRLELRNQVGDSAYSTTLSAGDSVAVSLPPGRYEYLARAFQDGRRPVQATGPAEVEEFAAELLPSPTRELSAFDPGSPTGTGVEVARSERRLGATPWPYLLLIALFIGEWVVRRRIGLR